MPREVPIMPRSKPKSCDFEGMIQEGQHPKGFTAQTPNGTAKSDRSGNCPGWNRDYHFEFPEVAATDVWNNANRSGE